MQAVNQVDVDRIEGEIRRILDGVGDLFRGKHAGNPRWTQELKTQLSELAKQTFGYEAYCSDRDSHEWLYDLVWLKYLPSKSPNGARILNDVPLALESEWSRQGILHDFQKLIISRARLRVMIFETRNHQQTDKIVGELCEAVRGCSQSQVGDRYLFAAWQNDPIPEKFRFVFRPFIL